MKWTIYQLLVMIGVTFFMWGMENINNENLIAQPPGEWTAVNSPLLTFLATGLLITGFYFIFLFEVKKKKNRFQHPVWIYMPQLCMAIGGVSFVLFLIGGTIGPLGGWVEQMRSLLYLILAYFLFLIFLFIFSFEHKRNRSAQATEKTIHLTFFWTLMLFFGLFFLF
ncbi:hypothetical protein SAMN04487936_10494 [Halobacillus dabanensis]|uniref:Uncharacterized protein n=1 Tax=Halobacillus dabanensis TaxID=240302 RepID=A0A1I3U0K0_HALDA|nr:hypothetical protein [Halobacillus dabanensis]SFJ76490.1 hypothetical protein SAMN04487936_10494 [Halobacillus dabanensis]